MQGVEFQQVSHHLKRMKNLLAFSLILFVTTAAYTQTLKFKLSSDGDTYVGTMKPKWFNKVIIKGSGTDLEGATGRMEGGTNGTMQFKVAPNRVGTADKWMLMTNNGCYPMQNVEFKGEKLTYTFPWDFQIPYTKEDLEILSRTDALLTESTWHNEDDRDCDDDFEDGTYSLYCALKKSTIDVLGDFNHRAGALNIVRDNIGLVNPTKQYQHRLMEFNNESSLQSIKELLFICQRKMEDEVSK